MHRQARVYVKTAFVQLLISVLAGALLLINAGLPLHPRLGLLLPVYYHLLMVGWATQLIGGVALWMFPVRSRDRPRGDERLGWIAYGALNSGLFLRAVAEPAHAAAAAPLVRMDAGDLRPPPGVRHLAPGDCTLAPGSRAT
ncbi:MAG: hypothetical protein RMJ48_00320 [Roseiflexaceae bacterium]|nr:hypothetical protein [Roseiflexaceae bacterium]